jgi:hypothetical protein
VAGQHGRTLDDRDRWIFQGTGGHADDGRARDHGHGASGRGHGLDDDVTRSPPGLDGGSSRAQRCPHVAEFGPLVVVAHQDRERDGTLVRRVVSLHRERALPAGRASHGWGAVDDKVDAIDHAAGKPPGHQVGLVVKLTLADV